MHTPFEHIGGIAWQSLTVSDGFSFNQTDFDFSSLYYGWSYTRTGTLFRVDYGNGYVDEFRGTGFKYNSSGEPTGGTVTGYSGFDYGNRLFYIEGGSVAVTKIAAVAKTYSMSDDVAVISEVLKGNDTLTGANLADVVLGFGGNDSISGKGGNDILIGYDGNDTIVGGTGADEIDGGAGSDTASYAGASVGVIASLSNPAGNTNEAVGDVYTSIESLAGSSYADRLYGDYGSNFLSGGTGNDYLTGSGGGDWLYGGTGADQLVGGSGSDRFIFRAYSDSVGSGRDSIHDFTLAQNDRIDLSVIDASHALSGNQEFAFVGTNAFSGKAGELRYDKARPTPTSSQTSMATRKLTFQSISTMPRPWQRATSFSDWRSAAAFEPRSGGVLLPVGQTLPPKREDAKGRVNESNLASVLVALDKYGDRFGMDRPHRLAQDFAQLMHESGDFRYDREIWGPTPAQQRYDTLADIGNTLRRMATAISTAAAPACN